MSFLQHFGRRMSFLGARKNKTQCPLFSPYSIRLCEYPHTYPFQTYTKNRLPTFLRTVQQRCGCAARVGRSGQSGGCRHVFFPIITLFSDSDDSEIWILLYSAKTANVSVEAGNLLPSFLFCLKMPTTITIFR